MRALKRAIQLREATYRSFVAIARGRAPRPADLEVVHRRHAEALAAATPVWRKDRLVLRWDDTGGLARPWFPVATAATALLASENRALVRQCGNDPCGWLFIDHTKNRSRRWCSTWDCGNATRVKRFRALHRAR